MTNLHRPEASGQVVSFERPSHYWLRRARRHRKRGSITGGGLAPAGCGPELGSGALRLRRPSLRT